MSVLREGSATRWLTLAAVAIIVSALAIAAWAMLVGARSPAEAGPPSPPVPPIGSLTEGTDNPELSVLACDKADFNFVIDMSGPSGPQDGRPSNLPALKAGIINFVNAYEAGGGDGLYSGTRFNGSSASTLTAGFVSDTTFTTIINGLSGPDGRTPTAAGINTARANNANDRADAPNIMFVITDGSPNTPRPGGGWPSDVSKWLGAANAAIGAANDARAA